MKRAAVSVLLPLVAAMAAFAPVDAALGADRDKKFFESAEGEWVGPGEIVAGKYKGTKFTCSFTGKTPSAMVGLTFDGACRVGVFTQKMSAKIEKRERGYGGTFMDGAEGKGLDIIGGNVADGRKVILSLNRKALNGAMIARLPDENTMTVTVSVRVEKALVPVIGMNLKRVDGSAVGAIAEQ